MICSMKTNLLLAQTNFQSYVNPIFIAIKFSLDMNWRHIDNIGKCASLKRMIALHCLHYKVIGTFLNTLVYLYKL